MFKAVLVTVLVLMVLSGCGAQPTATLIAETPTLAATIPATVTPTPTLETPVNTTGLAGPYIGQKPPGLEPEIFAPGLVSSPDMFEYSGSFSPDGNEYYFKRIPEGTKSVLLFSRVVNGLWTVPAQVEITAAYPVGDAHISPDNQWLFFVWRRIGQEEAPLSSTPQYYATQRTGDEWSEPVHSGQGMFLSSSKDGELYTTDMADWSRNGNTFIAKVTVENGIFTTYERIKLHIPFGQPAHPCIAPDGSYLLFDVDGGSYLFVSFRAADGTWGEPIDLGANGFDRRAGGATISPDGKYLFFALKEDIYWVDSQVIEALRPVE